MGKLQTNDRALPASVSRYVRPLKYALLGARLTHRQSSQRAGGESLKSDGGNLWQSSPENPSL